MINNDLHHSSLALLSYRSVTGKYIHEAQKIERTIEKKVGWVASSIFTRFAACGLPFAAIANLIYDPCKRVQSEGYAQGINRCKQLGGDLLTMTFGAAWTVLSARWAATDIDVEIRNGTNRDEELVLQYFKAGANLHNELGCCGLTRLTTPLGSACILAQVKVVKALIKAQVDLNGAVSRNTDEFICKEKMPPLKITLDASRLAFVSQEERARRTAIFKALIDAGAVIHDGSSLLDLAISRGYGEIVDLLLDRGFRHSIYNELHLALRFNLPHYIPHALPAHLSLATLRPAIVSGSWEALHLFWTRFRTEVREEGSGFDTLIGRVLCAYFKNELNEFGAYRPIYTDLGHIGSFLQEALSKEIPSEREKVQLRELMNKVIEIGNPQDNLFFICAFLFPDAYEEWVKIFSKRSEPGKKEAVAAILSTYQVVVKNYVEKEKADHFSKGSLLDLSDIVRSYIFSEENDQDKKALKFFDER